MDLYWEIVQRNLGVYEKSEQEKIKNAKICIVGVGCIGGMDAYILARIGAGKLRLVDFDTNEVSNMNRQPMATYSTVGRKKVEAAKEIIADLNPTVEVEPITDAFTEENGEELLKGCDVVIQAMDNMAGRIMLHRTAKKMGIPSICMTGQPPYRTFVSTVMPDGPLYEEMFGIDFAVGKTFKDNPELKEQVLDLKYARAEHAAKSNYSDEWLTAYKEGRAGWGITPERAYMTSVFQCHEALALVIGRKPKAPAPKAYITDLNFLAEFGRPDSVAAVIDPPNGKTWDYAAF